MAEHAHQPRHAVLTHSPRAAHRGYSAEYSTQTEHFGSTLISPLAVLQLRDGAWGEWCVNIVLWSRPSSFGRMRGDQFCGNWDTYHPSSHLPIFSS
jgi:hypothetical protein